MDDEFVLVQPSAAVDALGVFALKVRSSVVLAADSVKEKSLLLAESVKERSNTLTENMKEKSATFTVSISENAAVVKTKSMEVAENVKEKTVEVAGTMKKGAVAVAENVQGRIAPKTVKREGSLLKQVNGNKWSEYYFVLRDGSVHVLPTQGADKAEFSITLDCVTRADPLDNLVTGKPYCFRVTILLQEKPTTIVNNWSFFGFTYFASKRINNQEIDIILQAPNEDEMKGWVRDLYSISSGLALQDQLKKTGEGALKFASSTFVLSFMYRAGRNVADSVIPPR